MIRPGGVSGGAGSVVRMTGTRLCLHEPHSPFCFDRVWNGILLGTTMVWYGMGLAHLVGRYRARGHVSVSVSGKKCAFAQECLGRSSPWRNAVLAAIEHIIPTPFGTCPACQLSAHGGRTVTTTTPTTAHHTLYFVFAPHQLGYVCVELKLKLDETRYLGSESSAWHTKRSFTPSLLVFPDCCRDCQ